MVFSSITFLFAFLPLVFLFYFVAPGIRSRNFVLLGASLFFYAWGERALVGLLVLSIVLNYALGRVIEHRRQRGSASLALVVAVVCNLFLLGIFKYANFIADNASAVLSAVGLPAIELDPIHLPLGISFFTFQALTYVVDTYHGKVPSRQSLLRTALYISLFPQLVAGPIVRYHTIATRLARRFHTRVGFARGIQRFVIGLGKKVLIADVVAAPADAIFRLPTEHLDAGLAWLAVICYTLQIYFDFSGYSDMAIGLGHMFGFKFPENFSYPYVSRSVREFWRRWHISLSTWFRDYLYVPLGGSRGSRLRTSLNLLVVFFLCGLWHGASWSFVVWGLFHGAFLATERTFWGRWLGRLWRPLRHVYVLLVVMVGWVIFRSDSLLRALEHLGAMVGLGAGAGVVHHVAMYLNPEVALVIVVGALGSIPLIPRLGESLREGWARPGHLARTRERLADLAGVAVLAGIFVAAVSKLAGGTYSPFIYFRF